MVAEMNNEIILLLLTVVLLTAVVTDLRARRIPNWLTFPTMLLGVVLHAGQQGMQGMAFSVAGAAVGMGLLIAPYLAGGMGAGDAKLMGAVGALLGPKMVLAAFLCTGIVGGVYALVLIVQKGSLRRFLSQCWTFLTLVVLTRRLSGLSRPSAGNCPRMRYGLAIALGTCIAILVADSHFFQAALNNVAQTPCRFCHYKER